MGEQDVNQVLDEHQQRAFMKSLLDDLRALEQMLEGGQIESGVRDARTGCGRDKTIDKMQVIFESGRMTRRPQLAC